MTTLFVVRHGQSTWNADGLLQGQAPGVALSAVGHEQARRAAEQLASEPIVAIWCSDLQRAVETAIPIAERLDRPVVLRPELRERAYGSLEGRSSAEATTLAGDVDWLDPEVRPGGGESLRDVHARVTRVLDEIAAQHSNDAVVVVSHGDTIRVALNWLDGRGPHDMPWRDIPNGCVTRVHLPHPGHNC